MLDKDHYIVFDDGKIGYISEVCTCDKCTERGAAEYFITSISGSYIDCLKVGEYPDNIVYFGDSLEVGVDELAEYYKSKLSRVKKERNSLQEMLKFYERKLVEKNNNDR